MEFEIIFNRVDFKNSRPFLLSENFDSIPCLFFSFRLIIVSLSFPMLSYNYVHHMYGAQFVDLHLNAVVVKKQSQQISTAVWFIMKYLVNFNLFYLNYTVCFFICLSTFLNEYVRNIVVFFSNIVYLTEKLFSLDLFDIYIKQ